MRQQLLSFVFFLLVAFATSATLEIRPTDSNWLSTIKSLTAGTTLIVHAGTYPLTSKFSTTWAGTATAPIVIQAAAGEARPVFKQTSVQNIWDVNGSYFTVKGLEFTGGGRGIRLGEISNTSHVIFDSVYIHDTADNAFTANDHGKSYNNITLRYSEITRTAHTGECVYLGCQSNACQTFNSLIEFNYCHDTTTDGSGSAGSGFQIKTGSYNNIVRNNVCKNTPGVCVLMYDDYNRGTNLIEGNVVLNVKNDNGIQVTAGAIVRNNIIIGFASAGIAVISNDPMSGSSPRNVVIEHNTVYNTKGECLRLTSVAADEGWIISNNALYCSGFTAINLGGTLTGVTVTNNAYIGSVPAGLPASNIKLSATVAQVFADVLNNNVYPAVGSALIRAGDATHSTTIDFNGLKRGNPPTIGAYEFSTNTNPGWAVQGGIKQLAGGAAPPPPVSPPPPSTPPTAAPRPVGTPTSTPLSTPRPVSTPTATPVSTPRPVSTPTATPRPVSAPLASPPPSTPRPVSTPVASNPPPSTPTTASTPTSSNTPRAANTPTSGTTTPSTTTSPSAATPQAAHTNTPVVVSSITSSGNSRAISGAAVLLVLSAFLLA